MSLVSYARVSSDRQRRAGTIETQRREIQLFCEARHLKLDRMYEEDGFTGTLAMEDRPVGRQLMEDARNRKIQELIVYNTDRLGRDEDGIVAVQIVRTLRNLGLTVTSITEPMLDDTPSGRFMLNVTAGVAALDRSKFLQRSREGSQRLATKGNYLGGTVPFGLRVERANETAHLTLNHASLPGSELSEVDVVLKIFSKAGNEGLNCQQVADYLHLTGVPTPRSHLGQRARWTREMVRRIITNPVYKGELSYGKRTRIKGGITRRFRLNPRKEWIIISCDAIAIVDKELWERANATVKRSQLAQMVHAKNEYLLSGLIKCGVCGRNYIGVGPRYRCNGRHGAKAYGVQRCTGITVRRAELEAMISDDLRGFLKQPGLVIHQLKQQLDATDGGRALLLREIRELEKTLARLADVETRNVRHLNEEVFTREQFLAERKRIEEQKVSSEQRLTELCKSAADMDSNVRVLQGAESLLESLRAKTDRNPTFPVRRQIAEALVECITVETVAGHATPKITVVYRFDSNYNRYVDEGITQAPAGERSAVRRSARGVPGH